MLFWGENRPEWIVALWGCILEGVIAVPIDFRSSASIVERIAGIVSARALLIGEAVGVPSTLPCPVYFPTPALSTDNAVMIAAAAFPKLRRGEFSELDAAAQPNLVLA